MLTLRKRRDGLVDPQDLLPVEVRSKWAVIPRHELYQLFGAGLLLGAGAAATVIGYASGPAHLVWGYPAAMIVCYVQAAVLGRRSTRLQRELGQRAGTQS